MKRKRVQEEEDVLIEKISNTSSSLKKKFILNFTTMPREKTELELMTHNNLIIQTLIDSMEQNEMKIFQSIVEEHPTLLLKNLFSIKKLENLEMLEFLFEMKIISKESLGDDTNLLIHFVSMGNMIAAEYLIKVQKFDLLFQSDLTGRTGQLREISQM
jgi:hypothetical protein